MKPFRVITADPPWTFRDKLPGPKRGSLKHYRVLSVDDICNLELPPIADDALLFLWRVSAMGEEAYRVARAWGFVPKSELVWVKTRGEPARVPGDGGREVTCRLAFGMGHYTRGAHETCLIARRGRASVADRAVRSVFFAPRGRHSEKPAEFYRLVEKLSAGPYVELFARAHRPGWTCIGDELGTVLRPSRGRKVA